MNARKSYIVEKGQALVTVVVFVVIAMTLTAGAIVLTLTNSVATSNVDRGNDAFVTAEAGAENALLRLLRDPSYAGETMTIGQNSVNVVVSSASAYTINATGRSGNLVRKLEVVASYTNGILTVSSWKEAF